MSHHSDLRLTCPQQPPLFWDPGGDYTEDDPNSVRRGDLMETRAPDLKQWWDYRRGARNEPFMKVFEWDLSPSEARHMHEKLRVGRDAPEEFKTHTLGRFCNVAVFSFLQRYALPADSRAQAHGLARHAGPAPMEAGSRPRVRLSRWPAVEGVRTREDGEEVRRLPATRYPLPVTRYPSSCHNGSSPPVSGRRDLSRSSGSCGWRPFVWPCGVVRSSANTVTIRPPFRRLPFA